MSTTSARLCASCGSPLPAAPPDARQVKCEFCAVINNVSVAADAPAQPIRIDLNTPDSRRAVRLVLGVIAAVVFLSLVVPMLTAGLGLYVAWRGVSEVASDGASTATALRSLADAIKPGPVAPADLAKLSGGGWKTLQVAAPSSGWAAFEPVGDLSWAMAIATAWQPDARLTRIDVSRLTADGIVNLAGSGDDSAGYRFESPAMIEEWRRRAREGNANPETAYELMVKLSQQKVTALVVTGKPSSDRLPPAPVGVLPLVKLMPAARKKPAYAQVSFFDGYMINNDREGWVWYFTGRGFDESLPRVRARDGATFPFR